MAENQDILSISFDYQRTQKEAGFVVSSLEPVLAIIEKLNSIKLNINSAVPTFAGAKKNADELTKSLKDAEKVKDALSNPVDLTKTLSAYDKLKQSVAEATKEARNLAVEFGKDSDQALKAAASADLLQKKLKEAESVTKNKSISTNVPFTTNLNTDGTIQEPTQGKLSGTVVSDVEKAQVEGILTAKEYAEAQKGVSASFVQSQENAKKYAVTQKEIDLALAQDKLTAQKRTAELKNQVREETAIKGSIEQRRAALIRLNAVYDNQSPQERNSAAGQRLQKITAGITEQLKQLEAASGRAQRNVGNYPVSSFNGLKAQLKDATDQYNNLTKAEQKSAQGKELKGKIDTISKSLKDFGDTSTISFGKAYSGIRILANIIPGLGISGIFLLAGQAIAATVDYVKELAGRVVDFAEKMKALSQVNLKAIDSFGEQRSHVEGLTAVIKDGNIAIDDKKRALKDLIALDPKYLQGLTLANINTAEGKKILGDYVGLLQRKAELEAAQAVSGDASKEVYKLEVTKELLRKRLVATKTNYDDLTEEELKYVDKVKTSTGRINFTASLLNLEIPKSDIQEMIVGVDKELTKAGKKVTASMSVFKDKFKAVGDNDVKLGVVESLKKQISDIDKAIDFEPIKAKIPELVATRKKLQEELDNLLDKKKDKKPKIVSKDFLDDVIKAQNEASRFLLEAQRDLNKSIEDDDRLSYTQRLMGLEVYNKTVIQLLELDKTNALRANKEKRDNDLKETGLTLKQKAQIILAGNIEQQNIENKFNVELQKTRLDQAKQLRDFEKNNIKPVDSITPIAERQKQEYDLMQQQMKDRIEADKFFNDIASTIDATNSAKEQDALLEKFRAGKISREKYESDLFDIQLKYAQKGIQLQIDTINEELKTANVDYDTRVKLQQQLAELQLKLHQGALSQAQKNRDEIVKTLQEIQGYFNQFADVLGGAINIGITQQKNALQDLEDQQQKNYQNEIDRINNSTLSQQDKAAQLKILEAQRQAQKDTFDRKNREEDLKKAKFDKATAIANIILNTAVSVAKVLANPFLIAVTAALGAAQLAIAIATPLPRFFKGKDKSNNYEGPAFVNDGGKVEPIKRADGSIEINPVAKPMVTFIGKDDIVYPSVEKFIEEHKLVQQKQPVINLPKQNAPLISIAQPQINVPETTINISPAFIKILEKHTNSVIKSSYSVNELGKLINSISEVRNNSVTNAGSTSIKRIDTKINNSVHKPVITTSYFPTTTFKPISNQEINNIMQRSMNKQVVYMGNTTSTDQSIVVLRDIKDVLKKINSKETKTNVFVKNDASWKRYQDEYYRR